MVATIDVHNHYYPEEYLEAIRRMDSPISLSTDEEGREVMLSDGSRIVTLTPPMTDLDVRLEDMDRAGIDTQVLSLSAPNVNFLEGEEALKLARVCNDAFAEINEQHGRFAPLASVPLQDPELAVTEAERAITELGLNGFIVGSNINGVQLNDDGFEQFFETVDRLDVPVFIHPMTPAGNSVMREYRLAPLVGFENEITLAISRLVFDGVLERHDLDIHLAHLGGTVPYLIERLNNGYRAYPECREHIDELPGSYLEDVYYDTVSFHPPALRCALDSVGVEQLILGSDYPHVIGDIDRAVSDIEELELTAAETDRILGGTVSELYDP